MENQQKNIYLIGKLDTGHYSNSDIKFLINDLTNLPQLKIQKVKDNFLNDDDKFQTFLKQLDNTTNNYFVFDSDVYQNICVSDPFEFKHNIIKLNISDFNKRILDLQNYGKLIPSFEFMYSTGTKEYAAIPEITNLMIPGTKIYPRDVNEIKNLPTDKYIIKYGLSSSNFGVENLEGTGQDVIDNIQSNKNARKCSEFVIIQKQSNLFTKCSEWRFMVLQDKIVALRPTNTNFNLVHAIIKAYKVGADNKKLNSKIYYFIKNIVNLIKEKISKDYFFARIDLVFECSKSGDVIDVLMDDVLSENFSGNIYLNEIEPLGSGLKSEVFIGVTDNGQNAITLLDFPKTVYNWISDALINIVSDNKSQVGGINKSLYLNKYLKYKSKYLKLKSLMPSNKIK
jgi:hypothetical protein